MTELRSDERGFWMQVYVTHASQGRLDSFCRIEADEAVRALRERTADKPATEGPYR